MNQKTEEQLTPAQRELVKILADEIWKAFVQAVQAVRDRRAA